MNFSVFKSGISIEGDDIFRVNPGFYKLTFENRRTHVAHCIEALADLLMQSSTQKKKSTKVKFKKAKK